MMDQMSGSQYIQFLELTTQLLSDNTIKMIIQATLLAILSSLLSSSWQLPSCSVAYPKVFGGYKGDTILTAMDYQATNLIAGGYTFDSDIGSTNTQQAVLVGIIADSFHYALSFSTITGFEQVVLTPDGSTFAALTDDAIMVFTASTGDLLKAFGIPDQTITKMILSDEDMIVLTAQDTTGYQVLSISLADYLISWAKTSGATSTSPLDLSQTQDAKSLQVLHLYSSNRVLLTTLSAATGGQKDATLYYISSTSGFTLTSYTSSINYIFENDMTSVCRSSSDYCLELSTAGYMVVSSFAQTFSVNVLHTQSGKTSIMVFNFNDNTVNRHLVSVWPGISAGKLVGMQVAAVLSQSGDFEMGATKESAPIASTYWYSAFVRSNAGATCQANSTTQLQTPPSFSTVSTYSSASSWLFTSIDSFTLLDLTLSFVSTINSVASLGLLYQNVDQFCTENNLLLRETGTFTQQYLSFKEGIASNIDSPSIAQTTCSGVGDVTISSFHIAMADGVSSLPDYLTFDPLIGTIFVSTSGTAGAVNLKVTQTLTNGQSNSYLLQLTGTNNAPDFVTPLTNLTVPLNGVPATCTLPTVYLDSGTSLTTVTALRKVGTSLNALPAFINFADNALNIAPTQYQFSSVGTYEIEICLTQSDGKSMKRSLFIFITNSAPYLTTEVPSLITLPIDFTSTSSFSVGSQDDEGHTITTLVRRYQYTSLPSFMTFNDPVINIAPTSLSQVGTWTIEIKVSDGGPLSTSYLFTVELTNTAPYFVSLPLQNQYSIGLNPITYTLPEFQDDEDNPVTITLSASWHISTSINQATRKITLKSTQYQYNYTTTLNNVTTNHSEYRTYYGIYPVTVYLSDGNMQSVQQFTLNVTKGDPFFKSYFTQFRMTVSFEYTYNLPEIQSFSSTTTTISIQSKPYYVTINGVSSLDFKPLTDSDVGSQSFSVCIVQSNTAFSCQTLSFRIDPNQLPVFSVTSLPTQTVKLNQTLTISLPTYSDFENQAVTVAYSYGDFETTLIDDNTTTVKTTNFSKVGDNEVNVTLNDGYKDNLYSFIIIVTNSPPYISSVNLPLQRQKFELNHTYEITLPDFVDDEDNSVSVVLISIPSFVTFESPNKFTVLATSFSMISNSSLYFALTDSQLQSNNYYFTIEIYNTAPFFESGTPLPNVTMRYFNPITIDLPLIIDNQSNPVFITATTNKSADPILLSFTEKAPNLWSLTLLPKLYSYVRVPTLINITLNDTNLHTNYTFVLFVTNEAPVFVSGNLDIVVNQKMNDLIVYPWPAFMDPEGDIGSVRVQVINNQDQINSPPTFANTFSYLTLTTRNLSVYATKFTQLGTTLFRIALRDGEPNSTIYDVSMTITNTAPYFLSSSTGKLGSVRIRLGEQGSFMIPPYKDDEGNQVFVTNKPLPLFGKSSGYGSYYFSPSMVQDIGIFQITGEISDGQPLSSKFTFTVIVFNEAPFFVEALQTKIMAPLNLKTAYIFPRIRDAEMLSSTMTVSSLSNWPKFVTVLQNLTEISLNMAPIQQQQIGDYYLSVELKDQGKASRLQFMTITVKDIGVAPELTIEERKTKIVWANIQKLGLKITQASNNGVVMVRLTNTQGTTVSTIDAQYFQINILGKEENVSFEIQSFINNLLSIKLHFRDSDRISNTVDKDTLQILVVEAYYIPISPVLALLLQQGVEDTIQIPKQYSQRAVELAEKFQSGAAIVSSAAVPGGILINLSLSMFIQYMWSLLNDLSFLTAMTLISFPVPGIAQLIQASILSFIYLDILQTEKWLSPLIFPENDDDDDEEQSKSINEQFGQNGFQDMMLIQNLGSTFVYALVIIFAFFVLLVTKLMPRWKKAQRIATSLQDKLMWNYSLRFLIQQYPPLIISSLINLYEFKFDTPGQSLSSALSVVILIASQIVTIVLLYKVNTSSVTSKQFQSKYGTLHEGISTETIIGRNWSLLIMVRWTVTSFIMVSLRDYYCLQVQSLVLVSILYLVLLVAGQPFKVGLNNTISAFNELMVSAYLYTLMMLMIADSEQYEILGNLLIVIIALSALVNLGKFIYVLSKAIKAKMSERKLKLQQKKNQVKKQISESVSVNQTAIEEELQQINPDTRNEQFPRKIKIMVKKQAPNYEDILEIQREYQKLYFQLEIQNQIPDPPSRGLHESIMIIENL